MQPVRVLVVDDSSVCRKLLSEALACNPQVTIAGTASTGVTALAKLPVIAPDIVTLDVEMPGMNGIETLKEIRRLHPQLPIIMLSALTETGAAVTLEALSLGASDYVTKPSNTHSLSEAMEKLKHDLIPKIMTLAGKGKREPALSPAPLLKTAVPRAPGIQRVDILAIGTSTGGPNALAKVLPGLPKDFPVPIVIVQHMPPLFTRMLAERLNLQSEITVREGEAGAALVPGTAWIAPGDYHMKVERNGASVFINLDHAPPENSCRPAVDVLFRSVAQTYGSNSLAVVMTGMGSDGTRGALEIRGKGGEVFAQDEASSVIWGMPGSIVSAGAADRIYSLAEISQAVVRRLHVGRTTAPPVRSPIAGQSVPSHGGK